MSELRRITERRLILNIAGCFLVCPLHLALHFVHQNLSCHARALPTGRGAASLAGKRPE